MIVPIDDYTPLVRKIVIEGPNFSRTEWRDASVALSKIGAEEGVIVLIAERTLDESYEDSVERGWGMDGGSVLDRWHQCIECLFAGEKDRLATVSLYVDPIIIIIQ